MIETFPPARWTDRQADRSISLEWHRQWSSAIDEALESLPYHPLMDIEVLRSLWRYGAGKWPQQIAILRADGDTPVGVVPLTKRGTLSWQLTTQLVQPYARFHVLPDHIDAALSLLNRYISSDNVSFSKAPIRTDLVRPEQSWVVAIDAGYDEIMARSRYRKKDRKYRRRVSCFERCEDRYIDLPHAVSLWEQMLLRRGHNYLAKRSGELSSVLQVLADQKRIKTFSLYDRGKLITMDVNLVDGSTLYALMTASHPEYRRYYLGHWGVLVSVEWACQNGIREYDMLQGFGHYKSTWAEPVTRSYKLVRGPLGSQRLARMVDYVESWRWRALYKFGLRS